MRPGPSDWTLRRRFTTAVAVAVVLLAALSSVVVAAFVRVGRTQTEVTVTYYLAVRNSTALLNAYLDQETSVRGFALTGNATFLTPYTTGEAEAARADAELTRLLRDRADLRPLLADTQTAARAWHDGFAAPLVLAVRRAGPAAAAEVSAEDGRSRFDAFRTAQARLEGTLVAERSDAVGRLATGRTVMAVSFLVLAALVVIAGAFLGAALRHWILLPLDGVSGDVRVVAEGDLDQEVAATGPPELRRLGHDVERMRRRIVREYQSVREANDTVEQQRRRLERQTEELRRSNAELEQFAYVASHDLQEPLRKVASFTDLLRRRYAGRLDDRADTYIDFAVDGAHRMQAIINDLLAFSRVGRIDASWGPVALADAAAAALRNLAGAIEESDATVDVGPLPTLPGDSGLLTQVFQNLIANAIKFRRPGTAPTVRVRAAREGSDWRIDVVDDGIGVDPQYADRIFVIFTRLNRREDFAGSGIGLALCKKIVEYHGGHIALGEHGDEPGATITFTLPSTDDRAGRGLTDEEAAPLGRERA